jgi:hypothetical protein
MLRIFQPARLGVTAADDVRPACGANRQLKHVGHGDGAHRRAPRDGRERR